MKKLFILTLVVLMTAGIASFALANGLGAGIAGSPHDFSAAAWNGRAEICRVCHAPHDHDLIAQSNWTNGLLWNHAVSSATYTMYDSTWSSTLDGAQSAQPDGTAKLCLACHDGTVAIDTFDKYAGGTVVMSDFNVGYQIPGANVPLDGANKDLRGTHPISIAYDEAGDGFLRPAATTAIGASMIADVLDNNKVQCSSCHDVHDAPGEAVAGSHLLRVAQTVAQGGTASGLCLTCHVK